MTAPAAALQDERKRDKFIMLPNMADDDLNIYEFRLLGHYSRVCGQEGGKCWQGVKTISERTGISMGMITKTRNSLEAKGFIVVSVPDGRNRNRGASICVNLVDRWDENSQRYSKDKPVVSQDETPDSPHETRLSHSETAISPGETNKINIYQEPEKQEKTKDKDSVPVANPEPVADAPAGLSVSEIPETIQEMILDIPHGIPGDEQWQPLEARSAASLLSTSSEASSTNQQHIPVSASEPEPVAESMSETRYFHNDLLEDMDREIPGLKPGDKPLYTPDVGGANVMQEFEKITGGTLSPSLQDLLNEGIDLRGHKAVLDLIESSTKADNRAGYVINSLKKWPNESVPKRKPKEQSADDGIIWNADGSIGGYR